MEEEINVVKTYEDDDEETYQTVMDDDDIIEMFTEDMNDAQKEQCSKWIRELGSFLDEHSDEEGVVPNETMEAFVSYGFAILRILAMNNGFMNGFSIPIFYEQFSYIWDKVKGKSQPYLSDELYDFFEKKYCKGSNTFKDNKMIK